MNPQQLKNIVEAALLTAGGPLPMVRLQALFSEFSDAPDADQIKVAIDSLEQEYSDRGIELKQVSSGYRIQARQAMGQWLHRLSEEKPARYSRALLETLALIAYRQPITRGGVEDIRGVTVSSSIIKTLLEREWIRVVGHRDVPGRPALYGTTKQFLDYFNLKSLSELPELAELRSIEDIQKEIELNYSNESATTEIETDGVDQASSDSTQDGSTNEDINAAVTTDTAIHSGDAPLTETVEVSNGDIQQREEKVDAEAIEKEESTLLATTA